MIKNFSDHAANERTFLAWVRTAIAVMGFGFLVEKFDLFLRFAGAKAAAQTSPHLGSRQLGEIVGLALMVLGLGIMIIATIRFLRTAKAIDDQDEHPGTGSRFDLALAVLLFLLGCALLAYLLPNLLGSV